ncbi:hypothetical protein [Actinoalloteichus hymeniacidonis]|uniref:Uncharacterized protein n=1 Tax=Actinoalloteichus hymeniacidonis TaxID=340345 RepID=A0AAC9MZW8_9PSEU|nr:hypothetical protein [Actinoalloteichus hymeniacidonis]AOS65878.1 hypothetical protein TL08_25510 [Actinoalloteichus hymeniacidonis]MBB5906028.1 hypothetical protein [Actinoalloteichus hymeniacidonis]
MNGPVLVEQDTLPAAGLILDRHLALSDDGPPPTGMMLIALCGVPVVIGPPPAEVLPGVPAAFTADCLGCQDVLGEILAEEQSDAAEADERDTSGRARSDTAVPGCGCPDQPVRAEARPPCGDTDCVGPEGARSEDDVVDVESTEALWAPLRLDQGGSVHLCRVPPTATTFVASCGATLPRAMVEVVDPGDGVPCTCCLLTSVGSSALLTCGEGRSDDVGSSSPGAPPAAMGPAA